MHLNWEIFHNRSSYIQFMVRMIYQLTKITVILWRGKKKKDFFSRTISFYHKSSIISPIIKNNSYAGANKILEKLRLSHHDTNWMTSKLSIMHVVHNYFIFLFISRVLIAFSESIRKIKKVSPPPPLTIAAKALFSFCESQGKLAYW